jgi:hypothetical protein
MSAPMFVPKGKVAILPNADSLPHHVLEIGTIDYAGSVFIRLTDGRMYATIGGKCLNCASASYIVPATDAHKDALKSK